MVADPGLRLVANHLQHLARFDQHLALATERQRCFICNGSATTVSPGYCLAFKQDDNRYAPGTQLRTILELYEMDRRLRLVLLDGIERVEVALRCAVGNTFALRYGTFGHLDPASFRRNFDPRRRVHHAAWLDNIRRAAVRSTELFIDHHKNKYHDFPDLPVWKMAEVITLGDLSMWFAALRDEDRRPIAEPYGIAHQVLASWLHSVSSVRNICAHHSRLWDRTLSIKPKAPDRA